MDVEITPRYAFIDESGTVGAAMGSHFLVVAVLSVSQPRALELLVRRALKKYGRRLSSGEIKAARAEEVYRQAMARAVYRMVERFPAIGICLDRRYTNENLRYLLEKRIREDIQDLPQKMVLIRQENSSARKELQAVDAVAWAFFQKYERSDTRFYDLIASKVIMEELINEQDWKKR